MEQTTKKRKLTKKQEIFVDEYVKDPNATKAAKLAKYSENSARQIGSENLSKPDVQEAINERIESIYDKIDEKWIIENIHKVMTKAFEAGKLADANKALEMLAKWKAMLTDKQIRQEETFEDFILKMNNQAQTSSKSVRQTDTPAHNNDEELQEVANLSDNRN